MSRICPKEISPLRGGATYPVAHRLYRMTWIIAWELLGSWTPTPAHAWRRILLRAFGANIDHTAKVYPRVRVWYPPNLIMEEFSTLGPYVNCYCMDTIHLGAHALVSQGAHLCGGTHNIDSPEFELQTKAIFLSRHCWIAAEAFVSPGVTVEEGAVLGARSVAARNLEAWGVYVGNPARKIRQRAKQHMRDA